MCLWPGRTVHSSPWTLPVEPANRRWPLNRARKHGQCLMVSLIGLSVGEHPICKGQPPLFKATNPAFSRWQSSFHGGKLHFGRWQSAVSKVTNCSFQGNKLLFSRWQTALFKVTNYSFQDDYFLRWQTALFKATICRWQSAVSKVTNCAFQGDNLLFSQGQKQRFF